jgi:CheY-like chemotaxis protein
VLFFHDFPRQIAFDTSPVCRYSPPLTQRPVGNPGKDGNVASGQRVLVVDEYSEMADVLQAVLEPRGVRVERALAAPTTLADSSSASPPSVRLSVVVVDEETAAGRGAAPQEWRHVPKVLIGTVSMAVGSPEAGTAPERYLRKPFHYADLVHAIEALIAAQPE